MVHITICIHTYNNYNILKHFEIGLNISTLMKINNNTPDEIFRIEMLRINTIQSSYHILKNISYFGTFINPSAIPFQGVTLMASGR